MAEVSIIVPVYRAEAYLRDCVDSILSQSFRDFEVFLVNDGSPDNCGSICEEYALRDSRVRVIHQENQGQAAARNHALEKAVGKWVCFVDSDDLIHPRMLERLYVSAVENGAGISMCPMAEAPGVPENFYAEPGDACSVLPMNEQTLVELYDRDAYPSWVACAKLIRREYILKHLFCQGRVYEDNEAVCHWMKETEKLVQLPEAMYFYRTNPDSTTQSRFSVKKLDYLWALESIIRFYDSAGYNAMKDRFTVRYGEELVNCCNGLRYDLQDLEQLRKVEKNARRFVRRQKLRFSSDCNARILDAAHPELMRYYWPLEGAVRTLRESGITGVAARLKKRFGKEQDT